MGHLLFVLALVGFLSPVPIGILLVGLHLFGWPVWRDLLPQARESLRGLSLSRGAVLTIAAGVLLAPFLLLPLYPPATFDSTMYHLPYAKAFAASGGMPFLPDLRFPVFPQLMEALFAGMLLFADDTATQLLQVLATLLTAGLVLVWGREAFGRAAGWLAAGIYLGNPLVTYFAGTAYVEPGLSLFATAALFAFRRWRRSSKPVWLDLAAVFAASAAATKYLGLFFVLAIGLILLFTPAPPGRARHALRFAAIASAFLLPCYGRIFLLTGNPVFPYFSRLFGASAWDLSRLEPGTISPVSVLTLPWDLVFRRETFGWHPPISPAYLLALPLMLFAAARARGIRRLLLLAAAYVLPALTLPRDPRYFLPILPLLSVAAAGALLVLPFLRRPVLAAAASVFLLLPGWLYVARHIRHLGPLPVTAEQRHGFLARRLPVYPAIQYLNRTRGGSYCLYAFYAENMPYFAEGRFLGDWFGPASFEKTLAASATPEALHRKLRALGADHLLLVEGRAPPIRIEDPGFQKLFRIVYSDPHARVFALAGR